MLFLNVKRKSSISTHSIWFKSFSSKSCFVDSLPHLFSSIPTTLPGALSPRDPILAHVACHQFPPQWCYFPSILSFLILSPRLTFTHVNINTVEQALAMRENKQQVSFWVPVTSLNIILVNSTSFIYEFYYVIFLHTWNNISLFVQHYTLIIYHGLVGGCLHSSISWLLWITEPWACMCGYLCGRTYSLWIHLRGIINE